MTRPLAVLAIILGVIAFPLALVPSLVWFAWIAITLVSLLSSYLSLVSGWQGEPQSSTLWGVWCTLSAFGVATALHAASWTQGRWWAWPGPLLGMVIVLPLPWLAAAIGRGIGHHRRWSRIRAAVVKRQALARVLRDL